MKHLKQLFALALAILMLISVAACGGDSSSNSDESDNSSQQNSSGKDSSSNNDSPIYGGTLVYGTMVSLTSLDTTMIGHAWNGVMPCVEKLGRIYLDSTYEWLLVDDMIRDNDAGTVTIKVKDGIKFHDDSYLTPEVVKWNIDRYINSGQNSVIGNPTKCELNNEGDVVVYFDGYSLDWEYYLCYVHIYSKEYMDEHGENAYANWAVGTGPYKMTKYETGGNAEFERFEDYHGEKGYVDKIVFAMFSDTLGMSTAFINSEIGWISVNNSDNISLIENSGYTEYKDYPVSSLGGTILHFNTTVGGPWADVNVRQAVALWGLDYDALAYSIAGELGFHNYQYSLEGALSWVAEKEDLYSYDKDKAMKMLSDAGYKDGFDTQIVANTDKTIEATALQSALKDLNINASTNLVADDATIRAEGKEPGVYLGLWGAKLDQTTNFTAHLAPNGLLAKLANWTDEADEIVNKIATATTREDKVKAMQDYVTYLCFDQCFMVPLYCTASKNYVQDNIHGLAESVQYNHTAFEKIWIG